MLNWKIKVALAFAPFCLDDDSLLLISPDKIEVMTCEEMQGIDEETNLDVAFDRKAYQEDFECFHSNLLDASFDACPVSYYHCRQQY